MVRPEFYKSSENILVEARGARLTPDGLDFNLSVGVVSRRNAGVPAGWIGCVPAAEWGVRARCCVYNDIRPFDTLAARRSQASRRGRQRSSREHRRCT